jgi:hypothetical protein
MWLKEITGFMFLDLKYRKRKERGEIKAYGKSPEITTLSTGFL